MIEAQGVILAGGVGSRFWPLSQPTFPKQFLKLFGKRSLIQETYDRIAPIFGQHVSVCSTTEYRTLIAEHLPEVLQIEEPLRRNTAPAIFYCLQMLPSDPETVIAFFPSDHYLRDTALFQQDVRSALQLARETQRIVLLGVPPSSPHTGYGYIETETALGAYRNILKFHEKPALAQAIAFAASPHFFWNAGMVFARKDVLQRAFATFLPDFERALVGCASPRDYYPHLSPVSFDVGVLEKASDLLLLPCRSSWSDVGSWSSLFALQQETAPGGRVVLKGNVQSETFQNCLVYTPDLDVALFGVEGLVIVQNGKDLLISRFDQDRAIGDHAAQKGKD